MRTMRQEYAPKIFDCVEAARKKFSDPKQAQKYRSASESMPVLILKSGLAQSVAFIYSRGEEPQKQLLEDLAQVVAKKNAEAFLQSCLRADLDDYMLLTCKSLLALSWFKRAATMMPKKNKKGKAKIVRKNEQ